MAFNLKKVLTALLFSSNQPLSIKDIQAAFTRFHEQATLPLADWADAPNPVAEVNGVPVAPPEGQEPAPQPPVAQEESEVVEEPQDPELYSEVPSLITATQIREVMEQIATEFRASDQGLLLIEGSAGYRLVTHPRFARWVRILRQEPPPVKLSQSSVETLAVVAYRQPVTKSEIETIRGVSAEAGIAKLLEKELVYIVGRADLPGRPLQYGTTDKFLEFIGVKSIDEMPASDVLSSRQIDEWLKTNTNPHTPTDADMGLSDEQLPLEASAAAPVETETGEPSVPDSPA